MDKKSEIRAMLNGIAAEARELALAEAANLCDLNRQHALANEIRRLGRKEEHVLPKTQPTDPEHA